MPKIKVSSSYGAKIPTGSYQNINPSFFAEIEMEISDDTNDDLLQSLLSEYQQDCQDICKANFDIVAEKAKLEKLQNDRKNFRFYGEYPSVTTIIEPDYQPMVDEDRLKIITAEGNILHKMCEYYINCKEWVTDFKKLDGIASDLLLLREMKHTFIPTFDFPAFLEKHKLEHLKNGEMVGNDEHKYAGTYDAMCEYDGKVTVIDFKRSPDETKNYMQIAAYSKAIEGPVEQMMIIDVNPDTKQGYSKPKVSTSIDKYFEAFLDKRKHFKETYGV